MKTAALIISVIGFHLSLHAVHATADEIVIFTQTLDKQIAEYSFERGVLFRSSEWNPTQRGLPEPLTEYVNTAAQHIAKVCNVDSKQLRVCAITFTAFLIKKEDPVFDESRIRQIWYVMFDFYVDDGTISSARRNDLKVVMLLDKTIAKMTLRSAEVSK